MDVCCLLVTCCSVFFFKQKTAYEMRISDWSSDVCSSDLQTRGHGDMVFGRHGKDFPRHDLRGRAALGLVRLGCAPAKHRAVEVLLPEIGRASCRERVCQYV